MTRRGFAIMMSLVATARAAPTGEEANPARTYETVVRARTPSKLGQADLKLTRKELTERGVHDLAQALDLLPQVAVNAAGRGGFTADLRGARKDSIMVVIDGIPVNEPFYGTFDLSSIPVTELLEVRVSLAPASPLDGPGGSGGVIEVTTRAAAGPRQLAARTQADTAGGGNAEALGRTPLSGSLSVRVSASAESSRRDLEFRAMDGARTPFFPAGNQGHGGVRLDYLTERTRIVTDLWATHRTLTSPAPTQSGGSVQVISPEDDARASLSVERELRGWRLGGRMYGHVVKRLTSTFADLGRTTLSGKEDLLATNFGVSLNGDRRMGRRALLALRASVANDYAEVTQGAVMPTPTSGFGSFGELAGGYAWTSRRYRLNADAGVALPLRGTAPPWPEAKLSFAVSPTPVLELQAIGGRKGRLPTLRERFAINQGNPDLAPERSTFGELRVVMNPGRALRLTALGFVRHTQGLIHFDLATSAQQNAGATTVRGVESALVLFRGRSLGGGGTYTYTDLAPSTGPDAVRLDFLSRHRIDGWLTGRYRQRVGATVRIRFASSQTDSASVLPPRTTVDLSAWTRLSRDFTATVRISNVLAAQVMERSNVVASGQVVGLSVDGVWD